MDDRRFDSLTRSLAAGASRRSLLKGLLGLGGAAVAGGALLEDDAGAAARPTPTPKPVKCPGNQVPVGGVCTCPASAPNKCGPACCTSVSGAPPSPTHTECCDNACCHGTCYEEELCCPTNPGAGEQPPTHQICQSAAGVECCPADEHCCEVDGCCDTVCWGGEDDNSNCCPPGAFCPGNDSPDICCTNNSTCCGAGSSANQCLDLTQEGVCCTTDDCPSGQICESNQCVTPCGPATVHIFAQTHGPLESQYVCPGPFENVVTEIGLYSSGGGACGETPIATASTSPDGPAIFEDVPAGQYCALPTDQSLVTCLDCPDYGVGVGVDLTVPCGGLFQWTIGIASCCIEGEKVEVLVNSGSGPSGCSEGTHLAGVPVGLYDCDSGELLYGPVSSNNDGFVDFESVPLGTYCVRLPADSSYIGCESCQDSPLYRSRIEVTCGQTSYPLIGICRQGETCEDGTCIVDDPNAPCQPGYFRSDGMCTPCAGGFAGADGLTCERCGPGTYAPSGSPACLPCAPGYYTDDSENDECNACPPGWHAPESGSGECTECPLGTYSDENAAVACSPCAAGTYTEHVTSTECIACNCQAGNMPEICGCAPLTCAPGYEPAGETCSACAQGTYSPDGVACLACPLGTYQDLVGQIGCGPCAAGSYTEHVGSTSCLVCNCGSTCNPTNGSCATTGVGGACVDDSQCFSGVCGCGAQSPLPNCMCRDTNCFLPTQDCSSGSGAVACCSGDCQCTGGGCFCTGG